MEQPDMPHIGNSVRTPDARVSSNFYKSDKILKQYLRKYLNTKAREYIKSHLEKLGQKAATVMDDLSLAADKNSPILKKRNKWGVTVNEIEFHPSYEELKEIAATSEMFYIKYNPELRREFAGYTNLMGFAAGQLFAMSELGLYCPLCMTDGAAYLVDKYAPEELRDELLPRLCSRKGSRLFTGAMYLTEKSGGSDVGRNLTRAEKINGNLYELNGEKWFCSNANADVMMVLARTGDLEDATRGLSLFLVRKELDKGERNSIEIVRLKDKLGVRSMATAEVLLDNTQGLRLGEEGQGFKLMAQMINISRIYNAVAAVSGSRRAVVEAYQYLNHRIVFGKKAIQHALIREKLHELGSLYLANFLLVWRLIRAMDKAENGNTEEANLLRLLTPMAKWCSAEHAVYITRESMELMGGNGYIEDFIMPKLFRDVNVLPIWEGSGNVIVLDILRAVKKSDGLKILLSFIDNKFKTCADKPYKNRLLKQLKSVKTLLGQLEDIPRESREATAKPLFKKLTTLYQIGLIFEHRQTGDSTPWVKPALDYIIDSLEGGGGLAVKNPADVDEIHSLIAWKY